MSKLARILLVTFLAVFSASTVAHAAGATTMAVNMALAEGGDMDMSLCESCDDDGDAGGDGVTCDIACIVPFAATLGQEIGSFGPRVPAVGEVLAPYDFAGRAGPPDPYPPRTPI